MFKGKLVAAAIFIIIAGAFIYRELTAAPFHPDINEAYVFPGEIQKMLEDPIANPLRHPTPPAPLPSHFKIPILLYHYVEYVSDPGDKIRISLNINPYIFEAQLKTLKDNGFTFMTPSQIPPLFKGVRKLPEKPVILTFDDGYEDFYTDVFPLLKKYQAKAVAYIVPGFLDKPNNLSRWQLKEISESGLVEIGTHTMHHAYLKGLDPARVKYEVEESKKELEAELETKIASFAYPYGVFDLQAAQIVKEAGFKTAVSTVEGKEVNTDNLYFLYRIRPGMRTGESLLKIL